MARAFHLKSEVTMRHLLGLVAGLMLVLLIVLISGAQWNSIPMDMSSDKEALAEEPPRDKFLGGLLTDAFDEASCLSRYQSALFWQASNHTPSPYLLEKLRRYEALHKKCGPGTDLYKEAIDHLKANSTGESSECSYLVWIQRDGLGNRMISIVSSFLYALLNDKVLLLNLPDDSLDLFCEPFPETSWYLPPGFPVDNYDHLDNATSHSFGQMLKDEALSLDMEVANASLPSYAYVYLVHDYGDFDKMFFLEESQVILRRFRWMLIRSNAYFLPAFFLLPQYRDELNRLFPEKDAVFHHLGRYLFHPTNRVWGYITRYYKSYLANADERLGIQIRIFRHSPPPFDLMLGQIMNCSLNNDLLPDVYRNETMVIPAAAAGKAKTKAVLVTTLRAGYFERIRDMYFEYPTTTGELISVYQPSHEEWQNSEARSHNVKALAELYLLSFCDKLVITAWSTYGYVAYSLGGLKPWIVIWYGKPYWYCVPAESMEPCFFDGKVRKMLDKDESVPHARKCEAYWDGFKLYNN